jgi:NAD(P)H-hydrate repair Nnr-like enzyme with NAD(P)H-hydrate dehydratase domain
LPQPKHDAAQESLIRVAVEHVDLAGLQRGKAVLRGQRDIADPGGIAERAGGECPAVIDVKALEIALRVQHREAGRAVLTPHPSVPRCLTASSVAG